MKKCKKIVSLVLALVLLLSFTVSSFGQETVENTTEVVEVVATEVPPTEPVATEVVETVPTEVPPTEPVATEVVEGVPTEAPPTDPSATEVVEPVPTEAPPTEPTATEVVETMPTDAPPTEPTATEVVEVVPTDVPPTDPSATEVIASSPEPLTLEATLYTYGYAYVMTVGIAPVYDTQESTTPFFTITQDPAVLLVTAYGDESQTRLKIWFITDENEVITGFVDAVSFRLLSSEEVQTMTNTLWSGLIPSDAGQLLAFVLAGEKVEVNNVLPTELTENEMLPMQEEVTTDNIGDFVTITTQTNAYSSIDETASSDYFGDCFLGSFVRDAIVRIADIQQDSHGRKWYQVRYLYGDNFADGTWKWTEEAACFVMAEQTMQTDQQTCTPTDCAYPYMPAPARMMMRSASAMGGFSLKSINAPIGSFYVGQSGVYGSSGKDSAYKQIASVSGKGTVYATPHYLNNITVYCLEHNLAGPGENISGGGQQPTGPYLIVDIDSYQNTPGYSSIIYHEETLHAIAWVLRHSYPFMVLDRSDSDNETWSRVAGQFAIRQVIRVMEGAQYVRDYWNMDNFYVASGQAPSVYLDYAKWLASNGIARGQITGNINVSNQSTTVQNGKCKGTVTLTTDADLMRIPQTGVSITGNSGGSDALYYYLHSGDTITLTSSSNGFSITVESVSSDTEEASFLVGVPSANIQKVLIPQYGAPYKLKSKTLTFDVPYGSITVTKIGADTQKPLSGAVFTLQNSAGATLQTLTTNNAGIVTFENLTSGTYKVIETTAPKGYTLCSNSTQSTAVQVGADSKLSFSNAPIVGIIQISKKDQLTKEALAGAEFTITRVSGLSSHNNNGEVVAVLTTDKNGFAETGWLTWGVYEIKETGVPSHYVDNAYTSQVTIATNGKTYTCNVENEPTNGWIQLTKTDHFNGDPIEGVQFDIYYNDEFGTGLAGTMTTDKNGNAVSPPLRKGKYIVRESANPTGYVAHLVELEVTVSSENTTYTTATNQPIEGKIQIVKKDQLTKEALAGAEFTITRISGLPSRNGNDNGEVVATLTTDANGFAQTGWLTWGVYEVKETVVPPHFVDNNFSTTITIDQDNQQTYICNVENEPTKGWIQITKTDRLNGNPIEGVTFEIYYNDKYGTGLAGTMTTGKDGFAMSDPLRKGQYIVKEVGETAGYLFEEITIDATIHSDEITELEATNQPVLTDITFYKRDAEEYLINDSPSTRGDGELQGTTFQVLAGEKIVDRQGRLLFPKGAVVIDSIQTTGDDACFTVKDLWPALYKIVETTPPTGYSLCSEPILVDTRDAALQSANAVIAYEGTKCNTVLYGALGIVKFYGDNKIHQEGVVENPEEGAVFEVYLKSAGSYEAARPFERDIITTDEYGKAQTKALPYGVYTLTQTVGKEGYANMKPLDFQIDGTENLQNPPSLILNNEAILYRLKIIKTDAETGKTIALANTAFQLLDAEQKLVEQSVSYPKPAVLDTFYTNDEGEVTLPETLTRGQYFIQEVSSPEGYVMNPDLVEIFIGQAENDASEIYDVTKEVPNDPVKGVLAIDKKGLQLVGFEAHTDDYGNEYHQPIYENKFLAGAVFEIRAAEDIVGKDGTAWYDKGELVQTITTTDQGQDASQELPLGSYLVTEIASPDGYFFQETPYEATIAFENPQTAIVTSTVTVENDYLPIKIQLQKEKEIMQTVPHDDGTITQTITTTAGDGFVFGLFTSHDIHYDSGTLMANSLVATATTDANGSLTFSGLYPHGAYYVKELSTPKGWKLCPDQFDITLDPTTATNNEITVSIAEPILNEIKYSLVTLIKVDITGSNPVAGATIEVSNEHGEVIYRAITNEHGEVPDIPVTAGTYSFKETLAPNGYALNEETITFTVDENGNVTGDTTMRDDYTRIQIMKQDEEGQPLEGVGFGLFAEDGTCVATVFSDAQGLITFERIPFGQYNITETAPLEGFFPSKATFEITIDGTYVNTPTPIATVVNQRMEVDGVKQDTSGTGLMGVSFDLLNAVTGEVLESVVTEENGAFTFTNVSRGDFIIRETKALDGYIPMEDYAFTIDENWTQPKPYVFINIPNHYSFYKTDGHGNPLAGVTFALEDGEGKRIQEITSDTEGIVSITGLTQGEYVIREIATVEGYTLTDETISLTIDENYIPPSDLVCIVNYKSNVIQTGFGFGITPIMCVGFALIAIALVLIIIQKVKKGR